jgi:hypothetical protein
MMRIPYHLQPFPSVPWTEALDSEGDFTELCQYVAQHFGEADRSCVDRWLLIYDRCRHEGLDCPSVLDLGCSSGLFSLLARLTLANDVVAVDDGSALLAGYDDGSVLHGLEGMNAKLGIRDIELVREQAEVFVSRSANANRSWDVTLCLGLLHHLLRGYGDLPDALSLKGEVFDHFVRDLARCTNRLLWIEVDETRVGPVAAFFDRISSLTGFIGTSVGLSCSGQGRPRQLFCFTNPFYS